MICGNYRNLIADLNKIYRSYPALYERGFDALGFEWIDNTDHSNSVLVFLRKGNDPASLVVVAINMTPVPRGDYRIGLPESGEWEELLNSDNVQYGGSGMTNGKVNADMIPWQGRPFSASLSLPPLGGTILRRKAFKGKTGL